MVNSADDKWALKAKVAEVAEKYKANISTMSSKQLLDEFEQRALMASYGYQDPITTMMLKESKAELLKRTKGFEVEGNSESDAGIEKQETVRPTLFG